MSFPARAYAIPDHGLVVVASNPKTARPVDEIRREWIDQAKAKRAVDRANAILDRLEARMESLKARKLALDRQLQACAERHERISDRVIAELEAATLTRADGFSREFTTQPCPAAVDITDASLLPELYWRQPKPKPKEPDKVKIKAALERKEPVPGARLMQGVSLRRQ